LGKASEARQHYEQALSKSPSIEADTAHGVIGEHSSLLHNLAGLTAQQGDVERALDLWNQSLDLYEKIGDVQGKAATLANMAWAAGQQGDRERQRHLNLEAVQAFVAVRAWLLSAQY
jgi:tetratricopeptide (TPR) repeat protein